MYFSGCAASLFLCYSAFVGVDYPGAERGSYGIYTIFSGDQLGFHAHKGIGTIAATLNGVLTEWRDYHDIAVFAFLHAVGCARWGVGNLLSKVLQ
jgi:hypothetical protein